MNLKLRYKNIAKGHYGHFEALAEELVDTARWMHGVMPDRGEAACWVGASLNALVLGHLEGNCLL